MTGKTFLAGRTLRGRLIAGLLALLALSCALVGIVTYLTLSSFLMHQLRVQLAAASNRYSACVGGPGQQHQQQQHDYDDGPPPPVPGCATISGQAAGTFTARLVDYRVVNADLVNGHCDLSKSDQAVLASLPDSGAPASRELPSLHGDYLLTSVSAPGNVRLVTGLPLDDVQDTLSGVEITEAVVFAAALALTGIVGTAWVRLSLRPLRRMTTVATSVTSLPLASGEVELPHRVPDDDPRTETGQLGAAFNRMLGHVESALSRREASEARLRQFAADASHELRTPLAAIRGYAEFARRDPGELPPQVAHALSRVDAESARMSVLVDELLLLAQLDAGRPLASEPVDLTRLAIDVTSDARVAAPGHRWKLDLPDEPVQVSGDEHRLHQVLANLLSNAARHTPAGTTVQVTVRLVPPGQPARDARPPAARPAAQSAQPPAGSAPPNARSAQPPAGSAQPSARSAQPPAGSAQSPAGSAQLPAGSAPPDARSASSPARPAPRRGGSTPPPAAEQLCDFAVADDSSKVTQLHPGGRPGPGMVEVVVEDDGPGIPAKLQESVFERFVRGDVARTRASGGTGLGLSIVAAVTAAHHGHASVTSRPGQTRFTITLPCLTP